MQSSCTSLRPLSVVAAATLMTLGLAAQAEVSTTVKFYGFVNAEVESVSADGGTTPYARRARLTDGNSRLGIRGDIAVAPQLKAIWQLEASLNAFDQGGTNDQGSTTTFTTRNSYVGLDSEGWGRLILGNHDSVYRSLAGSGSDLGGNQGLSTLGLDLWNNTSAQLSGNATSVFSRGEARYKNSLHYLSPVVQGLQAGLSYGFDEARAGGLSRARTALALKYTRGALQLGLALDQQSATGVDVERLQSGFGLSTAGVAGARTRYAKLLGGYTLPTRTYVGVGVEHASYGFTAFTPPAPGDIYPDLKRGSLSQTGLMASLAQDLGERATLMLSVGRLGTPSAALWGKAEDYRASQWSMGGKYQLNALLTVYAYTTRIRNKPQQSVNLGQAPLYSVNAGSSNAYLSPGDSPRGTGLGLSARF